MELQQAIKNITYASKVFPEEEFAVISANRDEAIPILRTAIENAIRDPNGLEDGYQLHFYALFFLGEFQDREFFPRIVEMASLPNDDLDDLIGDAVTSGLPDILYNTYNGDIELVKKTVLNPAINEYVRSDLLNVMGRLYLDGVLDEAVWKNFLRSLIHSGEEYSYVYEALQIIVCYSHFVDMLPEVRFLQDNGLVDMKAMGSYDSCVDAIFEYGNYWEEFCQSPMRADTLKGWAMFEQEDSQVDDGMRKAFQEMLRQEKRSQLRSRKIGRNDPCPCGSGKKYKFCCLNKPKSPLDVIESEAERSKCLMRYPYIGDDRQEGMVYLQDYYDADAIEIDRLLYLGLMDRPGLIWDRNEALEEKRCREYLRLAFDKFEEKVETDHTESFAAYDNRNSIHYFSADWVGKLLEMLDKSDEMYDRVKSCYERMIQ